jgi:hypothetical protein
MAIKNQCQSVLLPEIYQAEAAEKDRLGMLSELRVECECGATVGAEKSNMFPGRYRPSSHAMFTPPNPRARK